jgi:4-hydroxybenzoate polyprenyltransferase
VLSSSYATIEMGIILINTSEDISEDLSMGIKTTAVALGLRRTLKLASAMVFTGGIVFIAFWSYLHFQTNAYIWTNFILFLLFISCFYIFYKIFRLCLKVGEIKSSENAVQLVKAHGSLVPIWATMVGWFGVLNSIMYFIAKYAL